LICIVASLEAISFQKFDKEDLSRGRIMRKPALSVKPAKAIFSNSTGESEDVCETISTDQLKASFAGSIQ